jgi:hypothetical protein
MKTPAVLVTLMVVNYICEWAGETFEKAKCFVKLLHSNEKDLIKIKCLSLSFPIFSPRVLPTVGPEHVGLGVFAGADSCDWPAYHLDLLTVQRPSERRTEDHRRICKFTQPPTFPCNVNIRYNNVALFSGEFPAQQLHRARILQHGHEHCGE